MLMLGANGLLDSSLFSSVEGFQIYQRRAQMTKYRYSLSREEDEDTDFAGIPCLPESDKKVCRAMAEVLLYAFAVQRAHMLDGLHIVRQDEDLLNEVDG